MRSPYQLILLGAVHGHDTRLRRSVDLALQGLGIPSNAITFLSDANASNRSLKSPVMAVFFGSSESTADTALVTELIDDSIVIAPVVSDLSQFMQKFRRSSDMSMLLYWAPTMKASPASLR